MRKLQGMVAAIACFSSLAPIACISKPGPSTSGSSESASPSTSAAPASSSAASSLAELSGDRSDAIAAAKQIAANGDDATKRAAGPLIVKRMRAMLEPTYRDELRPLVVKANAQAGVTPTTDQLEYQVRKYQDEDVISLMKSLAKIGGPENVASLLELAQNKAASPDVKKATLETLQTIAPQNPAVASAVSAAQGPIKGPVGGVGIGRTEVSGGAIANAGAVVAGMAAGFRRCYNKGLAEEPSMKGTVKLTAKIGKDGEVLSASPSGDGSLSGTVLSCVAARFASATFSPPDKGSATVSIVVTMTPMDDAR